MSIELPSNLQFIHLKNFNIYQQLQLEEALLRTDDKNFLIVSEGSNVKSIVMGLSGIVNELIDHKKAKQDSIPIIKRFSGGGTVIVDHQTLFITWIVNKSSLNIPSFPEPIMKWSSQIYQKAWSIAGFDLKENDYCILNKKCGGNAQYITKDRWLHHTSFLLDFDDENMRYLHLPEKRPNYRQDRDHKDFLTRLKPYGGFDELIKKLKDFLQISDSNFLDTDAIYQRPHRRSTHILELE